MSEEEKRALADLWKKKFVPELSTAKETQLAWKRKLVELFVGDATTGDVVANLIKLRDIVSEVGLPTQEQYEEPWLPVFADNGRLVSGEVLKDAEGDVVGGDVVTEASGAGSAAINDKEKDDDDPSERDQIKAGAGVGPDAGQSDERDDGGGIG